MSLNELQKQQITKSLKRFNRRIWKDDAITKTIENVEAIQEGRISRKDFFIPGVMTWDDYLWQLNLIKYI